MFTFKHFFLLNFHCLTYSAVQLLQRLDLRLFGADFPFLAVLFVPRRSTSYFLGKTLFDTSNEAVSLFFLARSVDKVELLVFGQSDLLVVAW